MNLTQWRKKYNVPTNKYLARKVIEYKDSQYWYLNSFYAISDLYCHALTKELGTRELYRCLSLNQFIDVIAATSPRQSVKQNLKCAINVLLEYKASGSTDGVKCGLANKQIQQNLKRIVKHQQIRGAKVRPFAEALKGNLKVVVIDSWMLKCFNIKRQAPTPNDRKHITTVVKKIAAQTGLEPAEVQACLWSYAKTELNDTPFKEDNDYSYYIADII